MEQQFSIQSQSLQAFPMVVVVVVDSVFGDVLVDGNRVVCNLDDRCLQLVSHHIVGFVYFVDICFVYFVGICFVVVVIDQLLVGLVDCNFVVCADNLFVGNLGIHLVVQLVDFVHIVVFGSIVDFVRIVVELVGGIVVHTVVEVVAYIVVGFEDSFDMLVVVVEPSMHNILVVVGIVAFGFEAKHYSSWYTHSKILYIFHPILNHLGTLLDDNFQIEQWIDIRIRGSRLDRLDIFH